MNQAEPLVIRPPARWVHLELGELWTYRELLYFLTWRDLKVRYKQTVLGVSWAVLVPLIMKIVKTTIMISGTRTAQETPRTVCL